MSFGKNLTNNQKIFLELFFFFLFWNFLNWKNEFCLFLRILLSFIEEWFIIWRFWVLFNIIITLIFFYNKITQLSSDNIFLIVIISNSLNSFVFNYFISSYFFMSSSNKSLLTFVIKDYVFCSIVK